MQTYRFLGDVVHGDAGEHATVVPVALTRIPVRGGDVGPALKMALDFGSLRAIRLESNLVYELIC